MRTCEKCDAKWEGGPDPCLGGFLPGIAHACCGHGTDRKAYCCGWPKCKPGDRVTPGDVGPIFYAVEENGERVLYLNEKDWEEKENKVYSTIRKQEGYWEKRGVEAIEYMEKLKNGT